MTVSIDGDKGEIERGLWKGLQKLRLLNKGHKNKHTDNRLKVRQLEVEIWHHFVEIHCSFFFQHAFLTVYPSKSQLIIHSRHVSQAWSQTHSCRSLSIVHDSWITREKCFLSSLTFMLLLHLSLDERMMREMTREMMVVVTLTFSFPLQLQLKSFFACFPNEGMTIWAVWGKLDALSITSRVFPSFSFLPFYLLRLMMQGWWWSSWWLPSRHMLQQH